MYRKKSRSTLQLPLKRSKLYYRISREKKGEKDRKLHVRLLRSTRGGSGTSTTLLRRLHAVTHHGAANHGDNEHESPVGNEAESPQDVANGESKAELGNLAVEGVEIRVKKLKRLLASRKLFTKLHDAIHNRGDILEATGPIVKTGAQMKNLARYVDRKGLSSIGSMDVDSPPEHTVLTQLLMNSDVPEIINNIDFDQMESVASYASEELNSLRITLTEILQGFGALFDELTDLECFKLRV